MAQQNGNNVRRCGHIGDSDDDSVSMGDFLNEQERLQADADAVLGGSDEHNCTYPQGYLQRQALYACATCTPEGNAGVCLACSYACHEGHELYELYTKRHFSCDCGNEKFKNTPCQLYKEKKGFNARNHYNQNFRGLYCSCSRPYPDPEDMIEDEMIQCIVCEDWHHGRHLNTPVPDDFEEMICQACMSKFSFLWAYRIDGKAEVISKENCTTDNLNVVDVDSKEQTSKEETVTPDLDLVNRDEKKDLSTELETAVIKDVNVNSKPETAKDETVTQDSVDESEIRDRPTELDTAEINGDSEQQAVKEETVMHDLVNRSQKRDRPEEQETEYAVPCKRAKLDCDNDGVKEECLLKSLQQRPVDCPDQAAFWEAGWRRKLCRCSSCLEMYKDRCVEFLIDETDTVHTYEAIGRSKTSTTSDPSHEDVTKALQGMNRVQQIEVVQGFMDLKTELNEFLQGFARDNRVVTESDIRDFFQRMDSRKRERLHLAQNNCR